MHRENYANNSAKKFIQLFLMFAKSKSAAAFFIMLLAELNLKHNLTPPPTLLSNPRVLLYVVEFSLILFYARHNKNMRDPHCQLLNEV